MYHLLHQNFKNLEPIYFIRSSSLVLQSWHFFFPSYVPLVFLTLFSFFFLLFTRFVISFKEHRWTHFFRILKIIFNPLTLFLFFIFIFMFFILPFLLLQLINFLNSDYLKIDISFFSNISLFSNISFFSNNIY